MYSVLEYIEFGGLVVVTGYNQHHEPPIVPSMRHPRSGEQKPGSMPMEGSAASRPKENPPVSIIRERYHDGREGGGE